MLLDSSIYHIGGGMWMVHYPTATLQSQMQRKPSKDELLINLFSLLCSDYQFRDERLVYSKKKAWIRVMMQTKNKTISHNWQEYFFVQFVT